MAENEQRRTYEARIVYIVAKKKQFVAISPEILHDKFNTTQLPAYKRVDE
jgi:hypothetical protein